MKNATLFEHSSVDWSDSGLLRELREETARKSRGFRAGGWDVWSELRKDLEESSARVSCLHEQIPFIVFGLSP